MVWRVMTETLTYSLVLTYSEICKDVIASPNGAKTQLLMYTNTNYLLDLCILLGLFDKGYQLMA
jgi:hypothetical protein